jgi:ATP sulfurylase
VYRTNKRAVQLLVGAGARARLRNSQGRTPADVSHYPEVAEMLRKTQNLSRSDIALDSDGEVSEDE